MMKKLMMALVAGFMSVAVAGAYAGESKGMDKKGDKAMEKSAKGMDKKGDKAMEKSAKGMDKKDDKKGKGKGDKGEAAPK
jgi:hypothetical protein